MILTGMEGSTWYLQAWRGYMVLTGMEGSTWYLQAL